MSDLTQPQRDAVADAVTKALCEAPAVPKKRRRRRLSRKHRAGLERLAASRLGVYSPNAVCPAAIRMRKSRTKRRALAAAVAKAEKRAKAAFRWWLRRLRVASKTTKADLAAKARDEFAAKIANEWYAESMTLEAARAYVASEVIPAQREAVDAHIHIVKNECQQYCLAVNRTTLARGGVWKAQQGRALVFQTMQDGADAVQAIAVAASQNVCNMPTDRAKLFALLNDSQAALGDGGIIRDALANVVAR